jgi:rhodanese-related sulfurtransferase
VFKYVQRQRFRRELRINRINPQAAMQLIESGHPVTIVDLRHPSEIENEGVKIAGALILRPEDLRSRSHEISPQHEVILYCT